MVVFCSLLFLLTLLEMVTGLCGLPRGEGVLWNEVLINMAKLTGPPNRYP